MTSSSVPRQLWRSLGQVPVTSYTGRSSSSVLRFAQSTRQQLSSVRPLSSSTKRCSPVTFRAAARRSYSSELQSHPPPPPPPPPKSNNSQRVRFWPFFLVGIVGFGGYAYLINRRQEMATAAKSAAASAAGQLPAPAKPVPAFSPSDVTVIFVLGGPGAGKGTQCARLVAEHGFTHLSAGDLLRAEQARPGSQFGQLIQDCIKNGAIVPLEVTVALLENAMTEAVSESKNKNGAAGAKAGKARFLIDGFPRKMDQALKFEEVVCPAQCVLFYDCPEAEMERRLLERGKTSGRADDNAESIRKRFRTFVDTSMPVVDHYAKEGRVIKINATSTPEAVFKETQKRLAARLGDRF